MSLTWHIGGDVEPSADSWAAMVPKGGIRDTSTNQRDSVDDPATPIGAVYAAIRAGFQQANPIALATGLPASEVGLRLKALREFGLVKNDGKTRRTVWRLA